MPGQVPEGIQLAMQRAINNAQKCMEEYQLDRVKAYFTPDGKPLTERFVFSGEETLEVPRYSLVPQICLVIDEARLRYVYPISTDEAKAFRAAGEVGTDEKKPTALQAFFSAVWGKLRARKREPQEFIEVTAVFRRNDSQQVG
jgi:hypothetical protein